MQTKILSRHLIMETDDRDKLMLEDFIYYYQMAQILRIYLAILDQINFIIQSDMLMLDFDNE